MKMPITSKEFISKYSVVYQNLLRLGNESFNTKSFQVLFCFINWIGNITKSKNISQKRVVK